MFKLLVALVLVLNAAATVLAQPPSIDPESERQRWNRIFQTQTPKIRNDANQFLARVASELKPGEALDIGMGTGRNALHLARAGWRVTGVDVSDVGVEKARQQAHTEGLPLTAIRADALKYDYGQNRFDLIAAMYMGYVATELADEITDALKPGGHLVIEFFLRGPGKIEIGYDHNALPKAFPRLEVLRYVDEEDYPDFAQQEKRKVVRLLARKPQMPHD